jgi:mercuric ion transport protein
MYGSKLKGMKSDSPNETHASSGRGALLTGGLAAILASTCCLGPLVLITLGVSGAWISNLTLLQPYQPYFIGAALVALFSRTGASGVPLQPVSPGRSERGQRSTALTRRCSGSWWRWSSSRSYSR